MWVDEQSFVEFGFPGPRIKRYCKKDWDDLVAASINKKNTEVVFFPESANQIALIQNLLELGYLVPDNI